MTRIEKLRNLYLNSPQLSTHLPIKFSGDLRWDTITVGCDRCGKDIPAEKTHGTVNSLIPSLVTVEAVGICVECSLLVPCMVRLRSDGTMEYISDGQWVKTAGKKLGPLQRIRRWWNNHA